MSSSETFSASPTQDQVEINYDEQSQQNFILLRSFIHLVPFIAKLLSGQRPQHGLPQKEVLHFPLSTTEPQLMSQEAIDHLQEVLIEAIFAYLAPLGVNIMRYGDPRRGTVKQNRMWLQADWSKLSLQFSDTSIDIALIIYQFHHTKEEKKVRLLLKQLSQLSKQQSGDLLFTFLAYRNLVKFIGHQRFQIKQSNHGQIGHIKQSDLLSIEILSNNIHCISLLCQLIEVEATMTLVVKGKFYQPRDYQVLLQSEFRLLWPWFSSELSKAWLQAEPARWRLFEADQQFKKKYNLSSMPPKYVWFKTLSEQQYFIFNELFDLAQKEDRLDLLLPFIDYYKQLPQCMDKSHSLTIGRRLNRLLSNIRLADRQKHLRPFINLLEGAIHLADLAADISRRHPMDREWSDHLFLSAYQEAGMTETTKTIKYIINQLSPSIG